MRKIKYFFLFNFSVFFLLGCSFTKGSNQPAVEMNVKNKSVVLSENQVKILKAVEQGNLPVLRELLTNVSVVDYSFEGAEKTPIGLALQNDFFDITQLLMEKKIDEYNLGSYEESFLKSAFHYGMLRALASAGYGGNDESRWSTFNRSEKLLLSQIWRQVILITGAVRGNDFSKAKALFSNSKLSCHLLETNTILLNIQNGSFEKMFGAFDCKQSATTSEIEQLYFLTNLRSFQTLYTNVEFLSYLSRSAKLKSSLVYLEDYQIYVSPVLLFRISRSSENYSISPNYCKILSLQIEDCKKSVLSIIDEKRFFESKNIITPEFELVRLFDSYWNFKGQSYKLVSYRRSDDEEYLFYKHEDPLFAILSAVFNGYVVEVQQDKIFRVQDGRVGISDESIAIGVAPGESLQRLNEENLPYFKKNTVHLDPLEDFETELD